MFRLNHIFRPRAIVPSRLLSSPSITRDPRFKSITAADIDHFKSLLGPSAVITNHEDLKPFNADWMNRYKGTSAVALKPKTTHQVSQIMAYCHQNRIPVVPQGGNTGLVGGSVPVFDEVILSLAAMNQIHSIDSSGVVIAQAGVILEALDLYVAEAGYRVPLDLGAKGSCQIGGNVATNAGGSRFIRYGSLRGTVLGLEAVLPDGTILDTLTTLRKDNTGYDLKQLMIGAEGTLGVITRLALACPIKSPNVDTVVVKVDNFETVAPLLLMAKRKLGEILSAYEFMDSQSVNLATAHLSHVSDPMPTEDEQPTSPPGSGMVLIECAGSNADHNRQKLDDFLELAFEEGLVSNGVIAESETQSGALWELRESLPEAVQKAGTAGTLKYDLSLPLEAFYEAVIGARKRVSDIEGVHVVSWGHIGDGNLHLNISMSDKETVGQVKDRLEPWVYEFVSEHRGSVSAEHGLGVMKAAAIGYSKSDVAVGVMRKLKKVLDEHGICNPYKVLP